MGLLVVRCLPSKCPHVSDESRPLSNTFSRSTKVLNFAVYCTRFRATSPMATQKDSQSVIRQVAAYSNAFSSLCPAPTAVEALYRSRGNLKSHCFKSLTCRRPRDRDVRHIGRSTANGVVRNKRHIKSLSHSAAPRFSSGTTRPHQNVNGLQDEVIGLPDSGI